LSFIKKRERKNIKYSEEEKNFKDAMAMGISVAADA
jgi:hypothetical protein